jgi:hypothetical protein
MTVNAGVAAIKGTFSGNVMLTDAQPPHAFVLKASGSGAPGTVSTQVQVRLAETGAGTVLSYDADADVGGPIGGVGQRLLASVAQKTANEFFTAVNDVLTAPAPSTGPSAAPSTVPSAAPSTVPSGVPAAAPSATPSTVEGEVFTRPAGARAAAPGGFLAGAVFGAAAALLGALVGGLIATRARRADLGRSGYPAALGERRR